MAPLAERMRPHTLDELVGQDHLLYPGSPLQQLVDGSLGAPSVLLYAPPSTGKTSLARIIAETTTAAFVELSATSSGVKDVRAAIDTAKKTIGTTVVFIDEIHRFSKAQQDILLPAVESGAISLIGATTENPSFSVNAALRSRAVLLSLEPLGDTEVSTILNRALTDERGLPEHTIEPEATALIARLVGGDARQGLAILELTAGLALAQGRSQITTEDVTTVAPSALLRYDPGGDQHYDITSAFIKSMRASDPDAALHWLARLLLSGEDPRFIARRIVIAASEEVGMADPLALVVATSAHTAVASVGMPEARIILAQAVVHIATAPKSNRSYAAINAAMAAVSAGNTGPVPAHLRDAHYVGAADLGHGVDYLYDHDWPYGVGPGQPNGPVGRELDQYYQPSDNGNERRVGQTLTGINALRRDLEGTS